jgi:capsid protein
VDGAPGEKFNVIAANRPAAQFDPFFAANMKQIGMVLGIPFEVLIKYFSSSYTAARASLIAAEQTFNEEREKFNNQFCQPVYEEFLTEAVIKGRINAPGFLTDPAIRLAYCQAYWVGAGHPMLDEGKEVDAAKKRVDYGFSSMQRETAKMSGADYEDIVRERSEEKKMEESYGWTPAPAAGSTVAPPLPEQ